VNPRHHAAEEVAIVRAHIDATVARAALGLRQMADGARRSMRDALPSALRAQMMSPSGKFLVMIHPAQDVWEREPLAAYVGAMEASMKSASQAWGMQGAGLKATGVPMTVFESMKSMERSFALQALLATLLVVVLLWLDLRNAAQVMAALASLTIGVAWTVGIMALLGATFNLANFFAVPILIGLGIDSAIHMTHRAHEGALDHGFGSTRHAVIVTAMTTTIGFGALLLAHHQGLRSLGIAMSVGSVCCLISAVWTLPAILRVIGLRPKHASLRLVPADEQAKADAA
jgi:predicted RND superfamily exporter protein